MTTNIFAIHGAFSSPLIFNYVKHRLGPEYNWHFLNYQNKTNGLDSIIKQITPIDNAHVLGHSMGGLIALSLANQTWVKSITTIATPLSGININPLQSYLSRSEFINEISSHGDFIKNLRKQTITKPIQHLISTSGFNPFMWEESDGVISIRSQRSCPLGPTYDINANHAEIMLDDLTVEKLFNFWN